VGCNAAWSVGSQPTFGKNMLPPPSGSKNKPSKETCHLLRTTRPYIVEDKTLRFHDLPASHWLAGSGYDS
jgi:hypothetical protein